MLITCHCDSDAWKLVSVAQLGYAVYTMTKIAKLNVQLIQSKYGGHIEFWIGPKTIYLYLVWGLVLSIFSVVILQSYNSIGHIRMSRTGPDVDHLCYMKYHTLQGHIILTTCKPSVCIHLMLSIKHGAVTTNWFVPTLEQKPCLSSVHPEGLHRHRAVGLACSDESETHAGWS